MNSTTSTPTPDIRKAAVTVENDFLTAVDANLSGARGRLLNGTWFESVPRDGSEAVHKAMVERRLFGTETKHSVPQGRGVIVRGYQRRWIFGKRVSSVTVASVLAPPGPLLDGQSAPVSLGELASHVRELVAGKHSAAPHLVAVCSPTGFEDDAWSSKLEMPNVQVVLVAPRPGGGWRVGALSSKLDERLVRLFDPEGVTDKIGRVRRDLEERSTDLLIGGLSAEDVAERCGVPLALVQRVFAETAESDGELRLTRQEGRMTLYRGAPLADGKENSSMSVSDWIKSLFSDKGDETRKINHLIERRNALAQRRDRMYEDIAKLEKKEQGLLEEGKAASSTVSRRRIAAQVAQLRKEIERWNTTAAMLNQQINVIGTDIHNLTLLQQGEVAKLPDSEELTEHAVAAEEMLETLQADAKLVQGLEAGIAQTAMSDEELAVLKEFEAADAAKSPAPPQAAAAQARKVEGLPPLPSEPAPPQRQTPAAE